jgi:hypothetical protein
MPHAGASPAAVDGLMPAADAAVPGRSTGMGAADVPLLPAQGRATAAALLWTCWV